MFQDGLDPASHSLAEMFQLSADPGDYVFGQQAYDQLISRLFDQDSLKNMPPPASAEVIENLPTFEITESLMKSSNNDCAVCKEEFQLKDDAKILPCKHVFHSLCVQNWLKVSGTCPVCRYSMNAAASKQDN